MDWNQVEGNWETVKGKVREMWGKLSDNDLEVIKGKKQQLAGKLQERYGYTTEKASKEIDKFLNKFDSKNCESKDSTCCN